MGKEIVARVDIRDFGSFGDGINDDSPAILAALNAMKDFGGYRGSALGFPPGRYLMKSNVVVPDGLSVEGVGSDSILVLGPGVATGNLTGFTVPDACTAYFQNLQFEGPATPGGFTVRAITKLGTSGDLFLLNVSVTNPTAAGVMMAVGCRFVLGDCAQVGNDFAPIAVAAPLFYLGSGLWGGANSQQPQQIKGTVDPSAGSGVAAPEGSLYQRYAAGGGQMWVKSGAADTAWTDVVAGGGFVPTSRTIGTTSPLTGGGSLAANLTLAYSTAVAQAYTAPQVVTPLAISSAGGALAVNCALRNNFSTTLTENTTVGAPTGMVAGEGGQLAFTQDPATPRTLNWNAAWDFSPDSAPTMPTGLGKKMLVSYYYDGVTMWAVSRKQT